ncbi:MAG: PEP-CTERM sorting domain-containing protein [Armatimonadetes bacterium]|nr:PEP-CTERM sorting domain-containing protein [Armatimonadota bacterium]
MKLRYTEAAIACLAMVCAANAQTVQTIGSGSAVTSVDRMATFDLLDWNHNGTPLSDYTEDNMFIGVNGDSWAGTSSPPYFDPFHIQGNPAPQGFYFPDGGSFGWVSIYATDSQKIHALEFLYGNGWTTGDIYGVPWGNDNAYLDWETLVNGNVVSSGTVGPNPQLPVGTVVGFSDVTGFDELRLRCKISTSFDPNVQALAMDDMKVQFSAVPEPATLCILGVGVVQLLRRRRRS